jgi:hypothetical protein
MKRMIGLSTVMLLLITVGSSLPGPAADFGSASLPLTDRETGGAFGSGLWGEFFSGVGCGLGLTLMVSGYASGVAAPAAALLTVSTLAACARALDL